MKYWSGSRCLDFGLRRGAVPDIHCDLGQASNAGQRQNQRNRRRREAEGQLAPNAFGAGGVARSLSRGRGTGMRLPRSLPSALLPLRATRSSISTVSSGARVGLRLTRRRGLLAPEVVCRLLKLGAMQKPVSQKSNAFTLVEIMIVVAIIALLAAIAVPGFLRARKRSQASRIINDLRLIDSAVDQYAIENNKSTLAGVGVADWTKYVKAGTNLYLTATDILGNQYGPQTVDTIPKVSDSAFNALSDVVDATFWSPYH